MPSRRTSRLNFRRQNLFIHKKLFIPIPEDSGNYCPLS